MDQKDIFPLEIALLTQKLAFSLEIECSVKSAVESFCTGNYGAVLQEPFACSLFTKDSQVDLETLVQSSISAYLNDKKQEELPQRELELLLVGVSYLQLFVQNNWLGPRPSQFTPKHLLPENIQVEGDDLRVWLENQLSVDGEPVYGLATFPQFLYLARAILTHCQQKCSHLRTVDWWLLRCTSIHQQVLDDKCNTLRELVTTLIDNVSKIEPLMTDDKYRSAQLEFYVEAGLLSHTFYCYKKAHELFNTARKLSGLDIQLTGALGKRTRFQQTDNAQLLLQVTRLPVEGDGCQDKELVASSNNLMPKALNLDDDTVLEAINFTDPDGQEVVRLADYEQALILGLMEDYRRSRASGDTLTEEEILTYITFVLNKMENWSVAIAALLLRSKLEKGSRRRVERSMRQLEELFNQTMRQEPSAGQRSRLFYAAKIPPVWEIQRQLAELLLSLGAVGSALEIYEQLELWEDAIACYQRLGKTEKAETVIREQLAVHETPNLWCFLGDITRNIEHYEKAWVLSKHRSARAQRCMGYLYFAKEEYDKCVECFEKSLGVNALQVPVWFTYGCAAMAAKDFQLATRAFKRCVTIDYDNFEAWSNLATAYVKLKEKKKAFKTLNDALKCNYENWRIWENYLVVGTDCGEFSAVIRAYHRLMDLRDRWVDEQVLGVLVRGVRENIADASGVRLSQVEQSLRELFGRITSKVTDNAEIWRLYAELCINDTEKMLQFLQKSHRCVLQTSGWEKVEDKCKETAKQSLQLADAYYEVSQSTQNSTQAIQMLSSAKLMLRGVFTKVKQHHTDPVTKEIPSEDIRVVCSQLEDKMAVVVERLDTLKQGS
ncbi:tetratricopeptide repeat protein 27-like [Mya arenaria]|uniref:tetratricopeptide repeat protein 27-like n=1 Tax=Mya arenaria TaxID=6604 RepID=UPI0022E58A32|nr:tetratricopeptide repeat protein 27-like [Mya arenaria]